MTAPKKPKLPAKAAPEPKDSFNKLCADLSKSKHEVFRDFAAYIAGKKFKAS